MNKSKMAMVGVSAVVLSTLAFSAQATPLVTNGSFEMVNFPPPAPSPPPPLPPLGTNTSFRMSEGTTLQVLGWTTTRNFASNQENLTWLVVPTPSTATTGPFLDNIPSNFWRYLWPGPGPTGCTSSCFLFPATSPDGGNFVAIDGDPNFSATLSTTVNNLVKGQSYNVSFLEAAGQQQPLNGATTEWWDVSLGTEHHPSTLMNNDSHNFVDWIRETLTFTAMDTTETLSFFAKGTPGGEPPIVLLDGVSVTAVSEPETYALLGVGLLGILAVRRQRKKRV